MNRAPYGLSSPPDERKTLRSVLRETGYVYRIDPAFILLGRSSAVMGARKAVYAALRQLGWSYPAIGRAVGRDHSTVIQVLQGSKRTRKARREEV